MREADNSVGPGLRSVWNLESLDMQLFEEIVTSRKNWLNDALRPWCGQASRKELLKAEAEWVDLAGKVDPEKTLWLWAWSRFPELVHESLGIEETSEVEVRLQDGRIFIGFPNSRNSQHGELALLGGEISHDGPPAEVGPFSIDQIVAVRRLFSF